MGLSDKQKCFVEEYLIDLNATQAAIRASYSVKTANEQGARLLANVSIKTAIAEKMAERSRRTGVSQDRVILELAKIAFVNAADVIDFQNASIKKNAAIEDTAAIQSVKTKLFGEGGIEREIKMADKLKALELLGKHLGMWNDKLDVNMNIPIIFEGEADIEE